MSKSSLKSFDMYLWGHLTLCVRLGLPLKQDEYFLDGDNQSTPILRLPTATTLTAAEVGRICVDAMKNGMATPKHLYLCPKRYSEIHSCYVTPFLASQGVQPLKVWWKAGVVAVEPIILMKVGYDVEYKSGGGGPFPGTIACLRDVIKACESILLATGEVVEKMWVPAQAFYDIRAEMTPPITPKPPSVLPVTKIPTCECGAKKVGCPDYAPGHSGWCDVRSK
jgi:hypothetical protein